MKIITSRRQDGDEKWKDGYSSNFLLNDKGKFTILINHDKVIKSHGKAAIPLPDDLNNVIVESLAKFPREYLFTSTTGKEMDDKAFSRLLEKIIPGRKLGIDNLRSSYITWFYGEHHDVNSREALAKAMRHSLDLAMRSYHKVGTDGRTVGMDDDMDTGFEPEPETEPARDYDAIKKRKRELEKEWKAANRPSVDKSNAEYYEKNKFALNRISRLKDYNHGDMRAVPSARAIAKYGLKKNEATGLWY